jgi:hypothetical protein
MAIIDSFSVDVPFNHSDLQESVLTVEDQKLIQVASNLKQPSVAFEGSYEALEYIAIDDLEKIANIFPPFASNLNSAIASKFEVFDFWLKNFVNFLFVNGLIEKCPTLLFQKESKHAISELTFENMQRVINSLNIKVKDPLLELNLKKCVHASTPFAAFSHLVLDLFAKEIAQNYQESHSDMTLFDQQFLLFKEIRSFYLRSTPFSTSGLCELLNLLEECKQAARESGIFIAPASLDHEIKQVLESVDHLTQKELKALLSTSFFGEINEGCGFHKKRDELFYKAALGSIVTKTADLNPLFLEQHLALFLNHVEKEPNIKVKFDCYLTLYDIVASKKEFSKDEGKIYLDKCLDIAPLLTPRKSRERAFRVLSKLYEEIGEDPLACFCLKSSVRG